MEKLSIDEINSRLESLPGWKHIENSIEKEFSFKNFIEAFSFMSRVALLAERLGHHPDWSGGYNKVRIQLSTHDAAGITENDFKLASEIELYRKEK
jgi:4a-hydroxytetrahydrobiopterin dehydratase